MTLAIKGHETRGKEVIEILEMLGGMKKGKTLGNEIFCAYYIDSDGSIDYKHYSRFNDAIQFTLEQFLEKFPYKVGDKVTLDAWPCEVVSMSWDDGYNEIDYCVKGVDFYKNANFDELQPYKEQEPMDEQKGTLVEIDLTEEKLNDKVEIILNDDYEVQLKDGKAYIVKKHPQYPKTYEECCEVLGLPYMQLGVSGYKCEILHPLQQLLLYRDAYWKLSEWNSKIKGERFYMNSLPSFLRDLFPMPTEQMRYDFYNNFNKLLESCEEL